MLVWEAGGVVFLFLFFSPKGAFRQLHSLSCCRPAGGAVLVAEAAESPLCTWAGVKRWRTDRFLSKTCFRLFEKSERVPVRHDHSRGETLQPPRTFLIFLILCFFARSIFFSVFILSNLSHARLCILGMPLTCLTQSGSLNNSAEWRILCCFSSSDIPRIPDTSHPPLESSRYTHTSLFVFVLPFFFF